MRRFLAFLLTLALLQPVMIYGSEEKYISITFDDGPSGRYTQRLLAGLEKRNVKATFFLCGYRLETYPALGQQIFEAGHEIGLHSYSHGNMAQMSKKEILGEIAKNMALLPKGCNAVFLRPPGGNSSDLVAQCAKQTGLALMKWSVDPQDWAHHDAAALEAAVVESVRSGDVILLHDMCDCSIDAALAIIDRLQAQGFRFVTLSQLAQHRGITPQSGTMYCHFR